MLCDGTRLSRLVRLGVVREGSWLECVSRLGRPAFQSHLRAVVLGLLSFSCFVL